MSIPFKISLSWPFCHHLGYSLCALPLGSLPSIPWKTSSVFICKTLKPRLISHRSFKPSSRMAWPCSKCTFLNQNSSQSCQICLVPRHSNPNNVVSSSPRPVVSEWPCKTCTYLNKFGKPNCEMCGAMATGTLSSLLIEDELEVIEDDVVGTKFRPLQPCTRTETIDQSNGGESPVKTVSNTRKREADKEEGWVHLKKTVNGSSQGGESSSSAAAPGPISNSFLGKLHIEKISRMNQAGSDSGGGVVLSASNIPESQENLKSTAMDVNNSEKQNVVVFLTYNVWFREDLEVYGRMKALGELIEQHQPHFICFQEVTPNIYHIFQQSSWWSKYKCSVSPELAAKRAYFCVQLSRLPVVDFRRNPYRNTIMGRELCIADVDTVIGKRLVVATSHLESPCPAPPKWNQMHSAERVCQAKESLSLLKNLPNVLFGGDMNWDDKLDGTPPLPDGWYDVWVKLRPGQDGWTYDTKSNQMLTGNRLLQKRLDRIFCHLQDFEVESIDMIGTNPIPGLSHKKEKKTKNQTQILTLPVLPSDHYGLLLKILPKS
eukprot:Gb_38219 [translate_table: standard]